MILYIIGSILLGGIIGKLLAQSWYSFILAFIILIKAIKNSVIKKNLLGFVVLIIQGIIFNFLIFGINYLNKHWLDIGKTNIENILMWICISMVVIGSIPLMIPKAKESIIKIYKK